MTEHPYILLIDDNMADAKLTMIALKDFKIANKVIHFNDGEEALHFFFCEEQYKDPFDCENMVTGMEAVKGFAFSCSRTSTPSIPGILRSRRQFCRHTCHDLQPGKKG